MQIHSQGAHVLHSLGNELGSSDGINKPTMSTRTAQMDGLTVIATWPRALIMCCLFATCYLLACYEVIFLEAALLQLQLVLE